MKGHKARSISKRVAGLEAALPSAADIQHRLRQERAARWQAERAEEKWLQALCALEAKQEKRRRPLLCTEQALLIRHASERFALHAAQQSERQNLFARAAAAVLRLIARMPGLRGVLGSITRIRALRREERHALETRALLDRHARERARIARERRSLEAVEAQRAAGT